MRVHWIDAAPSSYLDPRRSMSSSGSPRICLLAQIYVQCVLIKHLYRTLPPPGIISHPQSIDGNQLTVVEHSVHQVSTVVLRHGIAGIADQKNPIKHHLIKKLKKKLQSKEKMLLPHKPGQITMCSHSRGSHAEEPGVVGVPAGTEWVIPKLRIHL